MPRIRTGAMVVLALAVAASTAAQTHAAGGHAHVARTKSVLATTVNGQFAFSPQKVTVKVGAKVAWKNASSAPHTVTGKGKWTYNKNLAQGAAVSFTFKKTGTYSYYCAIHPYMTGTIVVKK